jgi:hypothetical protein
MPGLIAMLRYVCGEADRGNEILDPENAAIMLGSTLAAFDGIEKASRHAGASCVATSLKMGRPSACRRAPIESAN